MAKDKYKSSTKITYIRDKVLPPPKKAQPISESTEKERERSFKMPQSKKYRYNFENK